MLAVGGFYIYVTKGMMVHCPGPYIAEYHIYISTVIMMFCYYSFYRACRDEPGVIKDKKYAKRAMKKYDFDEVMYFKDTIC